MQLGHFSPNIFAAFSIFFAAGHIYGFFHFFINSNKIFIYNFILLSQSHSAILHQRHLEIMSKKIDYHKIKDLDFEEAMDQLNEIIQVLRAAR